jgi:hypothetical protein
MINQIESSSPCRIDGLRDIATTRNKRGTRNMKGKSNTTRSIACWLGSLAVAALGAECCAAEEQPLNVIVVMTDDQGYPDLGVHGNPDVLTPNMDALAARSVRLTDFHVNPFCSPTRAAMLTGRMSDRTGVTRTNFQRN